MRVSVTLTSLKHMGVVNFLLRRFNLRSFHRGRHEPFMKADMFSPVSIVVISNGHGESPKSLLLDTGLSRYVINCGEGTQRLLGQNR